MTSRHPRRHRRGQRLRRGECSPLRDPPSGSCTSPGRAAPGRTLIERLPGVGALGDLVIQRWGRRIAEPRHTLRLPCQPANQRRAWPPCRREQESLTSVATTGRSKAGRTGWPTCGPTGSNSTRVANPAATPPPLSQASRPHAANKLIEPTGIIIDAKSGVSGAGAAAHLRRRSQRTSRLTRPAEAQPRPGDAGDDLHTDRHAGVAHVRPT